MSTSLQWGVKSPIFLNLITTKLFVMKNPVFTAFLILRFSVSRLENF